MMVRQGDELPIWDDLGGDLGGAEKGKWVDVARLLSTTVYSHIACKSNDQQ
jgi:hypothetical protein